MQTKDTEHIEFGIFLKYSQLDDVVDGGFDHSPAHRQQLPHWKGNFIVETSIPFSPILPNPDLNQCQLSIHQDCDDKYHCFDSQSVSQSVSQ